MSHTSALKTSNANCATSPMSPQLGGILPGFQSNTGSGSHEIKVLDEGGDYTNPNNIYNQLGSKLQSERSQEINTKVQSQNTT